MKELIDFDITQIGKDTKVVVFRVPFSLFMDSIDSLNQINEYCENIGEKLDKVGVKSLFIDDSTKVEPLTDDILNIGNLKHFNS